MIVSQVRVWKLCVMAIVGGAAGGALLQLILGCLK